MGCTFMTEEVKALTKKLTKEYKIPVDPDLEILGMIGYQGPSKTTEEKIQSFLNMLNKLEPGKTYVFIDHPGIDNEELRAVKVKKDKKFLKMKTVHFCGWILFLLCFLERFMRRKSFLYIPASSWFRKLDVDRARE